MKYIDQVKLLLLFSLAVARGKMEYLVQNKVSTPFLHLWGRHRGGRGRDNEVFCSDKDRIWFSHSARRTNEILRPDTAITWFSLRQLPEDTEGV